MVSSGITAIATTSDTAVELIAGPGAALIQNITIINEGSVAGFFSLDDGTTWGRLPAGPSTVTVTSREYGEVTSLVLVKREAGGSNLTGLWAFAA